MMQAVWTKRTLGLLFLLFLFFLAIDFSWIWKWMYPVYYPREIKVSAERHQVNPNLISAIIQTESQFIHQKRSRKGAIGLMQIMDETAAWIVEKGNYSPQLLENLEHPDVNIELGTWYLRYLLNLFEGNLVAAVAAYNAGQGNVQRWISSGIWSGEMGTLKRVPFGETRHYVQRVMYLYKRYQQIYGTEFWENLTDS